jgi:hypothetical protein
VPAVYFEDRHREQLYAIVAHGFDTLPSRRDLKRFALEMVQPNLPNNIGGAHS